MENKYKNFKYMESIQLILSSAILTEEQENEFNNIYDSFKQKKLNRGYENILKDLYILTKIYNFF